MTRSGWVLVLVVALVGIWAVTRIWTHRPDLHDATRDSVLAATPAVHSADSAILAHSDSLLRADSTKGDSIRALQDSARVLHDQLDRRDRWANYWKQVARMRADSLHQMGPPLAMPDGGTPIAEGDSSLACESRYHDRLQELSALGAALGTCQASRRGLRKELYAVRDTLRRADDHVAGLQESLQYEKEKPHPCRVNLLVARVPCLPAIVTAAVLGYVAH